MNTTDINRLLDVIEKDVVPKTYEGVHKGCKLFGAAILNKKDLSLVIAETNDETENPLWHGEMHAIKKFFELPKDARPLTKDCVFVATHEPCSLCLSGITWAGFDNFYYLFTYEDSRDAFGTPYDIQILEEVYRVPDSDGKLDPKRELYNRKNKFFTSYALKKLISESGDAQLEDRVKQLTKTYDELSSIYQKDKGKKGLFLP